MYVSHPGCSLVLAAHDGDKFADARAKDILLVATGMTSATGSKGSLLVGFASGDSSTPSSMRVDANSVHLSGPSAFAGPITGSNGIFGSGFSNLNNATFCADLEASNVNISGALTNNGPSTFMQQSTFRQGVFGYGFSNVNSNVYTATLSNAQCMSVGINANVGSNLNVGGNTVLGSNLLVMGPTKLSNSFYATGFSNVVVSGSGTTYASNLVGAVLTGCEVPYLSVLGTAWTVVGSNICLGTTSNVGIGVNTPGYALDVSGDVHTTGTVYANAFMVGTSIAPVNVTPTDLTRPGVMRNRIINGDMRINQRFGGGAQLITNTKGTYLCDRMIVNALGAVGSLSAQQTTIPSGGPGTGLSSCMLMSVVTPTTSAGATDLVSLTQRIEANMVTDLGWGTAGAYSATASFWISSSITGTFSLSVRNADSASRRSIVTPFTISKVNSWTRVVVCVTGDQVGAWPSAGGPSTGLIVSIVFTSGSSSQTSSTGRWLDGNFTGVAGQDNLMLTSGAQVSITGFQFERGPSVTPFELRPYDFELRCCRRYFYAIRDTWQALLCIGAGGYQGTSIIIMPEPLRVFPVTAYSGNIEVYQLGSGSLYPLSALVSTSASSTKDIVMNSSWVPSAGQPVLTAGMTMSIMMFSGASLTFDAEL